MFENFLRLCVCNYFYCLLLTVLYCSLFLLSSPRGGVLCLETVSRCYPCCLACGHPLSLEGTGPFSLALLRHSALWTQLIRVRVKVGWEPWAQEWFFSLVPQEAQRRQGWMIGSLRQAPQAALPASGKHAASMGQVFPSKKSEL